MEHFNLDEAIGKVPGFPHEGVLFYDITTILKNPKAFEYCIDRMCELYKEKNYDAVSTIEARGFLFAAPFALRMGIPLVLVRKKGKLPKPTKKRDFSLEYGTDTIEVQIDDIQPGKRYLMVDELIATGGTMKAAIELIEECGGIVNDIFSVIGLPFLQYEKLLSGYTITTLQDYYSE